HELRVADRPAHDLINEGVHRVARCPSVGDNKPGIGNGKGGAVDVTAGSSRFCAERRNGIQKRWAAADTSCASNWDFRTAPELAQKRGSAFALGRRALPVTKPLIEPLKQILRGLSDDGARREYCVRARLAEGGEILARDDAADHDQGPIKPEFAKRFLQ